MHEEVENCEIIAPRISNKLMLGEAQDSKYDLSKVGNMKPVEDAVFNSPIENKKDADYTVIPIKFNNEQNGRHSPNLLKEKLEQNNNPPIIHSDETKDKATSSLVQTDSFVDDLLIAEVVGDDFCDPPDKNKAGSNEHLATVLQKEDKTVNALDELKIQQILSLANVESETKLTEEIENKGEEEAQNSTSDAEELNIFNDTPLNNGQKESEIIASQIEELVVTEPSEEETECKEESLTVAAVNEEIITEHTDKALTTQDAQKEELPTSSNQNLEEAEAIPSTKEDEEDISPEREECECACLYDKAESVYDDTETSSSEDEENSSSCRAMKGREYFSHYQSHKKKENFALYPMGKILLPRGFLLHFRASTRREVIHMKREYIRNALLPLGAEIAFIDYQRGQLCGWVRFQESCPAIKILKQMTKNTILIRTVYMVFEKVSKKDEVKYLNKAGKEMAKLRKDKFCLDNKLKKKSLKCLTQLNN